MRENKIISKYFQSYFGSGIDLRVQLYNLLAHVGIIAGAGVSLLALVIKESVAIVSLDFSVAVISFVLLRYAHKKQRYHFCSWIFVIVVCFVFFPLLFFFCGGYKSGASHIFIIAFVFTAVLLDKYERLASIIFEFALYISCCLIVFYRPETVEVMPTEFDYLFVTILNFSIASILLLIVLLVCTRMVLNRRNQIEELNRELSAKNEALARYDTMKSDFLATVAHEIKSPLAVIAASGNDTIDQLNEPSFDKEEIIENQAVIERQVKMVDGILLDLMDVVAIENGRFSLSCQPICLSELLENICCVQFKRLDKNKNSIAYDLQPGLQKIWADPQRIEQVMANILSNACRHTSGGYIIVKLVQDEGNQIVSVIDNGEGMDAETARLALKQYVSTKKDYWRHGIGLFICRRIVEAHGGAIWITSEKGRGTVISFSLREATEYA